MIEPAHFDRHGAPPRLPEELDTADVRSIRPSGRKKHSAIAHLFSLNGIISLLHHLILFTPRPDSRESSSSSYERDLQKKSTRGQRRPNEGPREEMIYAEGFFSAPDGFVELFAAFALGRFLEASAQPLPQLPFGHQRRRRRRRHRLVLSTTSLLLFLLLFQFSSGGGSGGGCTARGRSYSQTNETFINDSTRIDLTNQLVAVNQIIVTLMSIII